MFLIKTILQPILKSVTQQFKMNIYKPQPIIQFSSNLMKVNHKKGSLAHKHHGAKNSAKKRGQVKVFKNYRIPTSKAMLKRIRIVGPRWNRQFKFISPSKYHLNRNKSKTNLRNKRAKRYICRADLEKVKKLIPYFKKKSFKDNH